MARLLREDGSEEPFVLPSEGSQLGRLRAVQEVLQGCVEVAVLADGRVVMVNEDGLSLELRDNPRASQLVGRRLVGPVLLCSKEEVLAWDAQ